MCLHDYEIATLSLAMTKSAKKSEIEHLNSEIFLLLHYRFPLKNATFTFQ